jgi:hypothetical protein
VKSHPESLPSAGPRVAVILMREFTNPTAGTARVGSSDLNAL